MNTETINTAAVTALDIITEVLRGYIDAGITDEKYIHGACKRLSAMLCIDEDTMATIMVDVMNKI